MLRTLSRAASLFVVVGLVLTSITPGAIANSNAIALSTDRAVIQPIGPLQPIALQTAQKSTPTIHLKSGDVTPGAPDRLALNQLARSDGGRVHILLQLDFIPRDQAKAEFEKNGVKLLAYVPDYAWIASVPASNPAAAVDLPGVTWAGPLTVNDKLDPLIRSGEWGSWNLTPDGTAAVYRRHASRRVDRHRPHTRRKTWRQDRRRSAGHPHLAGRNAASEHRRTGG